jgi:hypothetical protein
VKRVIKSGESVELRPGTHHAHEHQGVPHIVVGPAVTREAASAAPGKGGKRTASD